MLVKVRNLNTHPYREEFRGLNIVIPPGEHYEMEEDEAIVFVGTYSPIVVDGANNPMPEGYKMLKIERAGEHKPSAKVDEMACMQCKYKSTSKADLDEHINANHLDQMADADEKDKRIKSKAKQ